MSTWQNFLALFCAIGLGQSLFLGISLIIKDRFQFKGLFYIGIGLLGLAMRLGKSYFIFIPQKYPYWGVIAGGAGLWLIGPAFYLYVVHSIEPEKKSHPARLLHFVPSILIIITGMIDYAYYAGMVQFFIYLVLGSVLALRAGADRLPEHFKIYVTCLGLMLLCFVVQASGGIETYTIGAAIAIVILYGINYLMLKDGGSFNFITRKSKRIDQELAVKVIGEVTNVLENKKVYRNKGLTIADLAREANHPAYLISQSIRQVHQLRFNEFVNRFRVREAMEKLKCKETNEKIETIAQDIGFSSMSSLYQAFKKETNLTPQAYRNQFTESR